MIDYFGSLITQTPANFIKLTRRNVWVKNSKDWFRKTNYNLKSTQSTLLSTCVFILLRTPLSSTSIHRNNLLLQKFIRMSFLKDMSHGTCTAASSCRNSIAQRVTDSIILGSTHKTVKRQSSHITDRAGPEGSRKLWLPDFSTAAQYDGRRSALRTGRLYSINIPGTHFHYGLSRPQGHGLEMSLKNPMTPPGIDPGTFRLVAQRLNHNASPGPTHITVQCRLSECGLSGLRFIGTRSQVANG